MIGVTTLAAGEGSDSQLNTSKRSWNYNSQISMKTLDWKIEGEGSWKRKKENPIRRKENRNHTGILFPQKPTSPPLTLLESAIPLPAQEDPASGNWLLPPPDIIDGPNQEPYSIILDNVRGSLHSPAPPLFGFDNALQSPPMEERSNTAREKNTGWFEAGDNLLLSEEDITPERIQQQLNNESYKAGGEDFQPVIQEDLLGRGKEHAPLINSILVKDGDKKNKAAKTVGNSFALSFLGTHSKDTDSSQNKYAAVTNSLVNISSSGNFELTRALVANMNRRNYNASSSPQKMGSGGINNTGAKDISWRSQFGHFSSALDSVSRPGIVSKPIGFDAPSTGSGFVTKTTPSQGAGPAFVPKIGTDMPSGPQGTPMFSFDNPATSSSGDGAAKPRNLFDESPLDTGLGGHTSIIDEGPQNQRSLFRGGY